jgi:tetratricopeptide (TPR) repeat protein
MTRRTVFPILCAAFALACASNTDGFPPGKSAAWQTAFEAGSAAHAAGNYDEAELRLREALEIAQAEQPPGVRTGLCLNGIAALLIDRGRFGEAEPTLRRAIVLLEAGGSHYRLDYAAALTNAGVLALRQQQPADAERSFAKAVQIAESLDPPAATPILLHDLAGLAEAMRAQGRDEEADALAPRIAQLCQKDPSPFCASIPR